MFFVCYFQLSRKKEAGKKELNRQEQGFLSASMKSYIMLALSFFIKQNIKQC
jgi:hypothetical protein